MLRSVALMEPEVIWSNDDWEFVILASEPQLTVARGRFAPGQTPAGRHVHHEHIDSFYVLEGTMTFEVGPDAERVVVEAAGSIAIQPGVAHPSRPLSPGYESTPAAGPRRPSARTRPVNRPRLYAQLPLRASIGTERRGQA
jgi:hypothetical protein